VIETATNEDLNIDLLQPSQPVVSESKYCAMYDVEAQRLRSNRTLNVWDKPLYLSARYLLADVVQKPAIVINRTLLADTLLHNEYFMNPINGLIGVRTNLTQYAPSQSICDQSTIALLKLLADREAFAAINAPLSDGFERLDDVRFQDCNRSRRIGLSLLRAIDDYQKDCWAYCFTKEREVLAGFRQRLGKPFDNIFDNGEDPNVSPYERNISSAMTRLLVCDTAGWFDSDISDTAFNVFKMCAASTACASLCSGIPNQTNAVEYHYFYGQVVGLIGNLSAQDRSLVCTPSLVRDWVQPISQTAALFEPSVEEDSAGSAVAQLIDSLANPKTGSCPTYDASMLAMRRASGGALSPFRELAPSDSLPKVRAVRSPTFAACQDAIQGLYETCEKKGAMDLCLRADDPAVATRGSFETCDDPGLFVYRTAVGEYNQRCGPLGFPLKPTNGPVKDYFLPRPNGRISMGDCFRDKQPYIQVRRGVVCVLSPVFPC
jgi:hypothetical protein